MSRYLRSDEDIENVSEYMATLSPRLPAQTLQGGNAVNGKVAYGTCAACHGMDAKGTDTLKAPDLTHLNDWYILTQIQNYKTKIRGAHPRDAEGAQMAPMAMSLANEQMIKDVIAYIESLR